MADHYEPPSRWEYIRERDGIRFVYDTQDKHEWRFADAASDRLWHERVAAKNERHAAEFADDARDLSAALSGSGADWWHRFNLLCHATKRAIELQRAARVQRQQAEEAAIRERSAA